MTIESTGERWKNATNGQDDKLDRLNFVIGLYGTNNDRRLGVVIYAAGLRTCYIRTRFENAHKAAAAK